MTKQVPQDMQDVINEVSTTTSGRGDLANQYKVLDTIIEDSLKGVAYNSIANAYNTSIVDDYGLSAEITPLYELRVAQTHRLCGGTFAGTTPDTNIYTTVLTGSSTATISDRLMTLATGITANSTARIETVVTGQYTASNANFCRFVLGVNNTGNANNIRRWGATTTDNGFFFYIKGTEFGVGIRKAGIETYIPQTSFNASKDFVLDTNLHIYEIYYKTSGVYFTIDTKLVHTATITNVPLVADFNLKPAITNVNSNGNITNNAVTCTLMTVSRFGELTTNPFYRNLVGASTTTLKQSAGRLHSIIVNGAGVTGQGVTVYDNVTATGTKIGTIDLSKIPSPITIQYNSAGVAFSTGLTLVIVGAAVDITVIYE